MVGGHEAEGHHATDNDENSEVGAGHRGQAERTPPTDSPTGEITAEGDQHQGG